MRRRLGDYLVAGESSDLHFDMCWAEQLKVKYLAKVRYPERGTGAIQR